jgi:hypothetical protein
MLSATSGCSYDDGDRADDETSNACLFEAESERGACLNSPVKNLEPRKLRVPATLGPPIFARAAGPLGRHWCQPG